MILTPRRCPDCGGTGRHKTRAGLCDACHGTGTRRMTAAEERASAERSLMCPCGAVPGQCNGTCGAY